MDLLSESLQDAACGSYSAQNQTDEHGGALPRQETESQDTVQSPGPLTGCTGSHQRPLARPRTAQGPEHLLLKPGSSDIPRLVVHHGFATELSAKSRGNHGILEATKKSSTEALEKPLPGQGSEL